MNCMHWISQSIHYSPDPLFQQLATKTSPSKFGHHTHLALVVKKDQNMYTYVRHFSKFSILISQFHHNNVAHSNKYQYDYQVQNFPFCRLQPSRQGWPPPFDLELSNLFLLRTNYLISLFSKENLTPWLQNVFLEYDCN